MEGETLPQRREVYYTGMVQGVGFRYTARRIAGQFAVTGFVRNLPDGRVQTLAEGNASEVQRFFESLEAELSCYISRTERTDGAATGEFRHFDIRFS